jgi:hypothetical protein
MKHVKTLTRPLPAVTGAPLGIFQKVPACMEHLKGFWPFS